MFSKHSWTISRAKTPKLDCLRANPRSLPRLRSNTNIGDSESFCSGDLRSCLQSSPSTTHHTKKVVAGFPKRDMNTALAHQQHASYTPAR